MKVELELWHMIVLFMSFVSACWMGGRVLLDQFEKRLDERFSIQEDHRRQRDQEQGLRFTALDQGQRALERDMLTFKANLPEVYVRRDDHIRSQTVIEAKLDALAAGQSELRTLVARHE